MAPVDLLDCAALDERGVYVVDARRALAALHAAGELPDAMEWDTAARMIIARLQEQLGGGPVAIRFEVGPHGLSSAGDGGLGASGGTGGPEVIVT